MRPELTEKERNSTCDGKGTLRGDLEIMRLKVREENAFIIFNPENHSVLCFAYKYYNSTLYIPVEWNSYEKAYRWVREGCISELQEAFMELDTGFRTNLMVDTYSR